MKSNPSMLFKDAFSLPRPAVFPCNGSPFDLAAGMTHGGDRTALGFQNFPTLPRSGVDFLSGHQLRIQEKCAAGAASSGIFRSLLGSC